MKIKNMRKPNEEGQWGKVKAFFDVENSGFEMKGFRLVEGINGLFVSMPSQKGKNQQGEDEWFDTVWIEKELRDQLNQLALDAYSGDFSETLSSPAPQANKAQDTNEAPDANESEPATVSNVDTASSTSDDEIPF